MTASRGPGDASAGFGAVSLKPLPGEDILVRRLADAAAQAAEKGLAVKSAVSQAKDEMAAKLPTIVNEPPAPVVAEKPIMETPSQMTSSESGPRTSGVRRSSERARGKSKSATSSEEGSFE